MSSNYESSLEQGRLSRAPLPARQARAAWMDAQDQVWLAREARDFYTNAEHPIANLKAPSELDYHMLNLFASIEACSDDVDAKLAEVGRYVRRQDMLTRFFVTTPKVKITWQAIAARAARRDREMGKTESMWQTRINWNRMLKTVGPTWGSTMTISPEWIGPASLPQPSLEEPGVEVQ